MVNFEPGDELSGGYRIFDVRHGGMGVVYLCYQVPDRFYAVKAVKTDRNQHDAAAIEQFQKYFRDEVDLWIRICREQRHENIVDALLYNDHEGWLFLEYIDGLSLHEVCASQPVAVCHVHAWALGIARGMQMMHDKFNLVHRDLKPQNVLVSAKGLVAKITDLGIAKVLEDDRHLEDNTVIGTLGYRAPETADGITNFQSDIYSYGATLYLLLTGKRHLKAGQVTAIVPVREQNPNVPEKLASLIDQCLSERPSLRPDSFAHVVTVLEQMADSIPSPVTTEPGAYCSEHDFCDNGFWQDGKHQRECPFCVARSTRDSRMLRANRVAAAMQESGETVEHEDLTMPLPPRPTELGSLATSARLVEPTVTAPSALLGAKGRSSNGDLSVASGAASAPAVSPAADGGLGATPSGARWAKIAVIALLFIAVSGIAAYILVPDQSAGKNSSQGSTVEGEEEATDLALPDPGAISSTERDAICASDSCSKEFKSLLIQSGRVGDARWQIYCEEAQHLACSKCGWNHEGRDQVIANEGACTLCGAPVKL